MRSLADEKPLSERKLVRIAKKHAKFIAGGGGGGRWQVTSSSPDLSQGVVQGEYIGQGSGGRRGAQADLSHKRLAGPALRGLQLPFANLAGVVCTGEDLSGANLEGCLLVDSDWSGSILRGVNLAHADLSRADLRNCDLRQADLTGANLENADLIGADLGGALREGANLKGAWLEEGHLFEAVGVTVDSAPPAEGRPAPVPPGEVSQGLVEVVEGNTAFALDLYGRLSEGPGNLFFSPFSISAALAMTYAGARNETERQMAQALHFSLGQQGLHPAFAALRSRLDAIQAEGRVQLNAANALWPQEGYPFLEAFLAVCQTHYGVAVTPLNYAADPEACRRQINAWVAEQTRDKIANLIPPDVIDTVTRLVLVNAIYFKGDWTHQFEAHRTEEAPFRLPAGGDVPVQMMAQRGMFGYAALDGLEILEMPYAGSDLSMVIVLPGEVDGLPALERALTPTGVAGWLARLEETEVQVLLPRFRLEAKFVLNEVLSALGMPAAFKSGEADFTGMDGTPAWLYIALAIHQAFVEVNEQGTEAAAATAVIMAPKMALIELPVPVFQADHPFLFLIRERATGSILFLGRVAEPLAG